jgi:hypothetical protein
MAVIMGHSPIAELGGPLQLGETWSRVFNRVKAGDATPLKDGNYKYLLESDGLVDTSVKQFPLRMVLYGLP